MKLSLLASLTLLTAAASAAPGLPWRTPDYSVQADSVPAADLLRTFATRQGVSLQISDQSTVKVSGDFQKIPSRQFLDAVCEAGELLWFWDGSRLHIDAAADGQTRLLNVEAITPEQALAVFQSLGFESGPAARVVAVRGVAGVVTLSGGKRFLDIAEPVLKALNTQEIERAAQAREKISRDDAATRAADAEMQVRVFRLRYASAGDITVRGGSAQSTLPGVARALQNIMGTPTGSLAMGAEASDRKRQLTGLRGTGLTAVGKPPAAKSGEREEEKANGDNRALIQAEPRLNAIIVRDTAARMPVYEALIQQLDVSSPVIEISAAVVDIDTDNNKSLGVEFLSFGDGKSTVKPRLGFEADRNFNQGNSDNTGVQPAFADGTNLVRGSGFSSSVLVPVSGYELLARVRALEEKGDAQLVTSPSVITLDNVEANLRQDDTVYVRVAGSGPGSSSDLFDVRTGVQLRVTPTVVREGDAVSFRLVVDVQDGSFSDLTVDGVPSTRESAINTQAVVPADRTLLIGGYFVERRNNKTRQVPGLGGIPYLGRLFKRTENNQSRAQRFFFLTPRLVDVQKEARVNLPAPVPPQSKTPLPPALTDPTQVRNQAHELAGKSLPPAASAPAPAKP